MINIGGIADGTRDKNSIINFLSVLDPSTKIIALSDLEVVEIKI